MWEPFRRSLGVASHDRVRCSGNRELVHAHPAAHDPRDRDGHGRTARRARLRRRRRARLLVRRLDRAGDGPRRSLPHPPPRARAASCGWGSVPGDPFALLAMLTPARYYFLPATAAVNSLFGASRLSDFATADAARAASPARPARLLVAAARRRSDGRRCRGSTACGYPHWCWRPAATGWCARAPRGRWRVGFPAPASRSYPAPTTSSCSAKTPRAASQLVTSFLDERGAGQCGRGVGLHVAAVHRRAAPASGRR